jgi:hypothetical protein
MEFVKVGKNYMIKGSNGRIVSEKEKLQLERKELILEDLKSNDCQGKTTQKLSKNKKAAQKKKVGSADDIIKETNTTI